MTADGALNAIIITTVITALLLIIGGELMHRWKRRR
jgi:hypothetical protein